MEPERTWLVGTTPSTATTIKRSMDADMDLVYDLVYEIHVDTNCGRFSWNFTTSLANDPALFQGDTYSSYSQNGPESFLRLEGDKICVDCEPTGYETQLPAGVVKSIIDDLRDLAKTLRPSERQNSSESI